MNYQRRIANALEQLVDLQIVMAKSEVRQNQQGLVNDINDRVIESRRTGTYVPYDEQNCSVHYPRSIPEANDRSAECTCK